MTLKSRHIVAALALHLLLFGLLLGGAQCSRAPTPVNVIQGTLIRPDQLPRAQAEPKPQPQVELPAPEPTPAPEPAKPPKPDPAEAQRAQEQQRQKEAVAEKQKQEIVARQQADAKLAAQKAVDLKKQAEAEEIKRKADDLRKSAEAEDKKRAADDKKKKDLKAQLDAEAKRMQQAELAEALGAETQQRTAQEISIWGTQLTAALQRSWIRPPGLDQNLKCVINMLLSATGEVLSAKIRTSSGNPLYDESVVRAAYKASPLPLPRDPTVFQNSINITFVPRS